MTRISDARAVEALLAAPPSLVGRPLDELAALLTRAQEAAESENLPLSEALLADPPTLQAFLTLVASPKPNSATTKTCYYCNARKKLRQFHSTPHAPDGLYPLCTACMLNLTYSDEDAALETHRQAWNEYQRERREARKREKEVHGRVLRPSERPANIAKRIRRNLMSLRESRRKTEARELRLYGQILTPECREFVENANRDWSRERGYYMMPHQKRELVTAFMKRTDPTFTLPPYSPKPRSSTPPAPSPAAPLDDSELESARNQVESICPDDLTPEQKATWVESTLDELSSPTTEETPTATSENSDEA